MAGPLGSIQSARGRFYQDPGTEKRYPSVTTILDVLAKPWLVPWAAKIVGERAVQDMETLYEKIRLDGEEGARKWLSRAYRETSGRAAVRGSDLHDLAERNDKGEKIIHDLVKPETARMLSHYRQFLTDFSVQIIASEVSLVNRTVGYAGAADGIARIAFKEPAVLDIKTSPKGPYASWALQLSAYSRAELMMAKDPESGEVTTGEMIKVSQDEAFIVQVTPEFYRLIEVDISGQFERFSLLKQVFDANMDSTEGLYEVVGEGQATEVIDLVAEQLRNAANRAALEFVWMQAQKDGVLEEHHTAIAQETAKKFDKAA